MYLYLTEYEIIMHWPSNLREGELFNEIYIEHTLEKCYRTQRRKNKFNSKVKRYKKKHWPNRTGEFRDPDYRRGPKHYRTKPQSIPNISINGWSELRAALLDIRSGERNHDHYRGISGLNRERLRLAQSLRDKKVNYKISYIIQLNFEQIQAAFNIDYSSIL